MSWATRKKLIYLGVFAAFLIFIVAPAGYLLYPQASCSDGRMNQDETGIDCGGSCEKICERALSPISVDWQRAFKVTNGIYSAVAYVTNPNFGVAAVSMPYIFKFYDDRNILIAERAGVAIVPPSSSIPVFEGLVEVGSRVPARVFFEWRGDPKWESVPEQPNFLIRNQDPSWEGTPRLTAEIVNEGIDPVRGVSLVAVVYDENDIAIAASQTLLGTIPKTSSVDAVFTWPESFPRAVGSFEIYPVFLVR